MSEKVKVGIVYGGNSFEHEVSKMTAKSILENIDRDMFQVSEIYITREGEMDLDALRSLDVAFLAMHGPNCEDGKLQKQLDDLGVKYTGAGVESSRLNMDKIEQHEAFKALGLKTTDYVIAKNGESIGDIAERIESSVKYPCFIKPNNGGSSVGTSKVDNELELAKALEEAFKCDDTAIIEGAIDSPRELEVAVLGNNDLIVSNPGEIMGEGEFYSYETKYFDPFATATVARLDDGQTMALKSQAEKAYRGTGCKGYSRVDFFLDKSGTIYINEINTLPGFTKISMFPKMMDAMGIPYKELITRIIELALDKASSGSR